MSEEFDKKLNIMWAETFKGIAKRLSVYCDKHGRLDGTQMQMVESRLSSRGSLDEPIFIYNFQWYCGATTAVIFEGKDCKKYNL